MVKTFINKYIAFIIFGLLAGGLIRGSMLYNERGTEPVSNKLIPTLSQPMAVQSLGSSSADEINHLVSKLSKKQQQEVDTMARTIYGEARGEKSDQALMAIAHVILNRANHSEKKWASCPIKVSRQKYQFSCWNKNDPNYKLITRVTLKNKNFRRAYMAALTAINSDDITNGANHYHSVFMRRKPRWAKNKKMIALARIGNHKFYRA